MHYVKSLESGSWWDSAKRRAYQVEPGTVVGFEDHRDAAYFGDGERGEPVAQKAVASPNTDAASAEVEVKPKPKPKPKPKEA